MALPEIRNCAIACAVSQKTRTKRMIFFFSVHGSTVSCKVVTSASIHNEEIKNNIGSWQQPANKKAVFVLKLG